MTFGSKLTVEAFKAKFEVDKLDVIKNPKNGNLFVSASGATVAAVSKKFNSAKPYEFVELIEGELHIWCLVNQNTNNLVMTL